MVMDSGPHNNLSGMMRGLRYDDLYSNQHNFGALGLGESQPPGGRSNYVGLPQMCSRTTQSRYPVSTIGKSVEGDSPEDSDIFYSDMALSYISRMLMEEDIDEKISTYKEESALRAAEKPFYDILGQKYPSSPDRPPPINIYQSSESPYERSSNQYMNLYSSGTTSSGGGSSSSSSGSSSSSSAVVDNSDSSDNQHSRAHAGSVDYSPQTPSSSSNSVSSSIEEPFNNVSISPNLFFGSVPAWHFKRGIEEARKFLPINDKLVINLESNDVSSARVPKREGSTFSIKAEGEEKEFSSSGSKVRKNLNSEDLDLAEGRSNKQSAVSSQEEVRSEMFDMVLLCQGDKCSKKMSDLREAMQNEASRNSQNGQTKGSSGGKARGKKQTKKEVVDLRTLLILCAQAVAADDRRTANELLKQIRQHSFPHGDGSQRLAHCFADGLEARLAGTGSQIYHALVAKRTTATDVLKAYHLYLAACPFKRISHFFSNQTILNLADKASKVHIIDFGIYFGFQWPCLIQRLASRDGGPPKLRITGIDVPQPGFRPTERIEETGRRLADYAKSFNVPFEYQAIASKWETIRVEDLHIAKDEVVVVNCLYRFRNLIDETVVVDSPRNRVLNTIRKMNPDAFIHAVVNGSYSAPFFITRFREALFHFSALFDMLDMNVPRDDEQRSLIERDLFGREALNVIACEGPERVERPETYKQWQVRNLRAGFVQLRPNPDIMKKAKDKVKGCYHKDFVIDEDGGWLIQGWKGRIVYAISAWKPKGA
ncbi:scarecrow-like protein 9 [Musa acuminata AAA Group]|uniref:scarecrow-like protein 9 n=1 Tax=Musa acuminata AAA Group TaxID=214697 RepID=UPI0031DDF6AB